MALNSFNARELENSSSNSNSMVNAKLFTPQQHRLDSAVANSSGGVTGGLLFTKRRALGDVQNVKYQPRGVMGTPKPVVTSKPASFQTASSAAAADPLPPVEQCPTAAANVDTFADIISGQSVLDLLSNKTCVPGSLPTGTGDEDGDVKPMLQSDKQLAKSFKKLMKQQKATSMSCMTEEPPAFRLEAPELKEPSDVLAMIDDLLKLNEEDW